MVQFDCRSCHSMPQTRGAAPNHRIAALITLFALLVGGLAPVAAQAANSVVFRHRAVDPSLTSRIIVKWRTSGVAAVQIDSVQDRAARLSAVNGIQVAPVHNLFGSTDVMQLDHLPSHSEMQDILARLNADPGIEYAEPDGYRYVEAVYSGPPNDPHFLASTDPSNASNPDLTYGTWQGQWYLLPSSATTPSAISATTAWEQSTTGSTSTIIAVIDTGIIEAHPDLAGKLASPATISSAAIRATTPSRAAAILSPIAAPQARPRLITSPMMARAGTMMPPIRATGSVPPTRS
jgi:serine protease